MSNRESESSAGDRLAGFLLLVVTGLVLLFVMAIPLLVALVLLHFARPYMGRKEFGALLAVTAPVAVVWNQLVYVDYGAWLFAVAKDGLFGNDWGAVLSNFPWFAILIHAAALTAVLGLLAGTKIGGKLHLNSPAFRSVGARVRRREKDQALLNSDQRNEMFSRANVVPPPDGLTVSASEHSILEPQAPGKRKFPIGMSANGTPVYLSESEVRTHGLILGSTGSGKSETIKALAGALLDLGWSGLLLDLKEDAAKGGLRDWCETYATVHSLPYQELRLSDANSRTWFNGFAGLGPDESRDAVLAQQEFEAAYYEALNKELLGQLLNLMYWAHDVAPDQFAYPNMYDLAKICGTGNLNQATKKMRAVVKENLPGFDDRDVMVLSNPSKAQADSASGFGARLGNVFDTQAGRTVLRAAADGSRAELDVTADGLIYVGLDSLGKADLTRVVSTAVLQRLSAYAAARATGSAARGNPRFVIVDEANWVNREIVKNLLSRARSAGIALFLCTQGPNDWIDAKGDDWATLTQNMNVAIIMRQGEPEAANLCAEYFGKTMQEKLSSRISEVDGLLYSKRVRDDSGRIVNQYNIQQEFDYRIPPDTFRELTIGEAFVRVGVPEHRVEFARIAMRDPSTSPRF